MGLIDAPINSSPKIQLSLHSRLDHSFLMKNLKNTQIKDTTTPAKLAGKVKKKYKFNYSSLEEIFNLFSRQASFVIFWVHHAWLVPLNARLFCMMAPSLKRPIHTEIQLSSLKQRMKLP